MYATGIRSVSATVSLALLVSGGAVTAADAPALEANDCTPGGTLRGDAERGAEIHAEHCAECHGLDGKAEVIVMHMDEPPRDQSDPKYMKTMMDAYIYLAICKGGEPVGKSIIMPAWGDMLTDGEIKDLVAWIRTFSGT